MGFKPEDKVVDDRVISFHCQVPETIPCHVCNVTVLFNGF